MRILHYYFSNVFYDMIIEKGMFLLLLFLFLKEEKVQIRKMRKWHDKRSWRPDWTWSRNL